LGAQGLHSEPEVSGKGLHHSERSRKGACLSQPEHWIRRKKNIPPLRMGFRSESSVIYKILVNRDPMMNKNSTDPLLS
jgi:hypothetical protein